MALRKNDFEEFLKYLCYYTFNAVSNFKENDIKFYLIENELNAAMVDQRIEGGRNWADWPPDKIIRTLEVACKAAKKADPDCKLILTVAAPWPGWKGFLCMIEIADIEYDIIGIDIIGIDCYPCILPNSYDPKLGWTLEVLIRRQKCSGSLL